MSKKLINKIVESKYAWTSINIRPEDRQALGEAASFLGVKPAELLTHMVMKLGFTENTAGATNVLNKWDAEAVIRFRKIIELKKAQNTSNETI
jgi:hypothetical protein